MVWQKKLVVGSSFAQICTLKGEKNDVMHYFPVQRLYQPKFNGIGVSSRHALKELTINTSNIALYSYNFPSGHEGTVASNMIKKRLSINSNFGQLKDSFGTKFGSLFPVPFNSDRIQETPVTFRKKKRKDIYF